MNKFLQIFIITAVIVMWLLFPKNHYSPTINGEALGTTYMVKIGHTISQHQLDKIKQAIRDELEDINDKMSTYLNNSELSKFNKWQSLEPFAISESTFKVIAEAQAVSRISKGAFDITVGPLVNLWGFGPQKQQQNPPQKIIEETLQQIGYKNLKINAQNHTIQKLHPKLQLDLSAIAKGFAVDSVCQVLIKLSIKNYMVEIGGEIRVSRFKYGQKTWVIGIESPHYGTIQEAIPLREMSIATSGNYRNFRYDPVTKKRLSHTISPQTGKPIDHNLASVSVVSTTCMYADAMATTLMVLGEKEGYKLAQQLNLACYFIIHEKPGTYKVLQTDAFIKLGQK
ncbi:FAD:protein FMN transferase [Candidatus Uabimicrobium sp. HlEnr_7]|uniref:FAD:protein FMN transferase n=1 Tax=Candidatus Uabimicrobium helgolandensis TaxID=3095367 RepID=UPI003558FBF0